ncbi:MAG: hypothetical protein JJU29_10850 [Verrucomicrobia bacterium]|nr:hypothetical protein [Verrucomicrobiota bacterium]MCH8512511.1 hypothetical protein [Kiritimatiellia bacterium]
MQLTLTDFDIPANGRTLATDAIQTAIDQIAAAGGGTLTITQGTFLTGMIHLRDHVELHLCRGAVLKASPNLDDHLPPVDSAGNGDHWHKTQKSFHLIVAQGCRDIAITGPGSLDGNGTAWYDPVEPGAAWPLARDKDWKRMGALVLISECQNVLLRDVQLGNVCNWTLHLHESDHVRVRDILILNPAHAPNSDGIDITGCRNVSVSGCHIDTGDDAICLKTLPTGRSCEDIAVTHCVLRTHCVALKLGAGESFQDMRNVVFANCTVRGSHRAIGIYSLEGAVIENVVAANITFDTCAPLMFTRPIHIDLRRKSEESKLGAIRNICISGLMGESNGRSLLTAEPGAVLEDMLIKDMFLRIPCFDDPAPCGREHGGGQFSSRTPEARVERAAFVIENARNLVMDNIRIQWPQNTEIPEKWTFPTKLANGTHRQFTPEDWTLSPQPPVHAISAHNVHGGHIQSEGLAGWQGGDILHLVDCNWAEKG